MASSINVTKEASSQILLLLRNSTSNGVTLQNFRNACKIHYYFFVVPAASVAGYSTTTYRVRSIYIPSFYRP